ncbi:MAG TPA: hypothetical protein VLA66_02960, partial [Thermoanaerobaculia bacterium]|nr:hypothetical protein [Thermoanaerobaculia bacterium]
PRWAERLLTLEAVSISGALSWRPGSLRVEDGLMPLSQGEVRGQVELDGESKRAMLLGTWRRLAVGLEIEDERRDLHLLGAREWWQACCAGTEIGATPTP